MLQPDPTPAADRPPLDLDAIRAHVPAEAEAAAVQALVAHGYGFNDWLTEAVRVALGAAAPVILAAARAERPDPHDERDERCFACRNGKHSLCDRQACACWCCNPDAARAERTELATGDDVEVVALWFRKFFGASSIRRSDRECAEQILAALDLPGRETRRDDFINDLTAERDAANAALADVARLLDQARKERDELVRYLEATHRHAGLHDHLAVALGCKGCSLLARQHAGAEAAPDGGDGKDFDEDDARHVRLADR